MYGECLRLVGRIEEAMNVMLDSLQLAPQEKQPHIYGRIGFLCSKHRSPREAETWYKLGTESAFCFEGWVWLLRGVNLVTL